MESAAESLGLKHPTMNFYPLRDSESGLELSGMSWREGGTGDIYLTAAILFGTTVGNGGGAPGSMTDNAGCLIFNP